MRQHHNSNRFDFLTIITAIFFSIVAVGASCSFENRLTGTNNPNQKYSNHSDTLPSSTAVQSPDSKTCAGGYHSPPKEPRLEITLKIDLTQTDGKPAFLEFYTIPADEQVSLVGGTTVLAYSLAKNDLVVMVSGKVGRIQSVVSHLHTPTTDHINSKRQGLRRVLAKSKRWVDTLLKLHTAAGVIETTPEHPFYVNSQWVEAKHLKPGDLISSATNNTVEVINTELNKLDDGEFVFNLKVEGAENFYVGQGGLLAHNCTDATCANCRLKKVKELIFDVNDVGGVSNCVECAVNADKVISTGIAHRAGDSVGGNVNDVMQAYGRNPYLNLTRSSFDQGIDASVDGQRGIVFAKSVSDKYDDHAFNFINYQGNKLFFDAQQKTVLGRKALDRYHTFHYLDTTSSPNYLWSGMPAAP